MNQTNHKLNKIPQIKVSPWRTSFSFILPFCHNKINLTLTNLSSVDLIVSLLYRAIKPDWMCKGPNLAVTIYPFLLECCCFRLSSYHLTLPPEKRIFGCNMYDLPILVTMLFDFFTENSIVCLSIYTSISPRNAIRTAFRSIWFLTYGKMLHSLLSGNPLHRGSF